MATTAQTLRIGAHVDQHDPVGEALERGASLSQFFLGDPQGCKGPEVRYDGGADALRAAAEDNGVDLYVHAPYMHQRRDHEQPDPDPEPEAAPAAHGRRRGDRREGADRARWPRQQGTMTRRRGSTTGASAVEATDLKVPLLIENTAGGTNAMARHLDRIGRVWDAIAAPRAAEQVGFCLDTCHAHAGGIDLPAVVEKVRAITGRIDLVHANDSRDAFDSGADRHTSFGHGKIDPDELAAVVRDAGVAGGRRDARGPRRPTGPTSSGCARGSDAALTGPRPRFTPDSDTAARPRFTPTRHRLDQVTPTGQEAAPAPRPLGSGTVTSPGPTLLTVRTITPEQHLAFIRRQRSASFLQTPAWATGQERVEGGVAGLVRRR